VAAAYFQTASASGAVVFDNMDDFVFSLQFPANPADHPACNQCGDNVICHVFYFLQNYAVKLRAAMDKER
jgi:hypothetical protein